MSLPVAQILSIVRHHSDEYLRRLSYSNEDFKSILDVRTFFVNLTVRSLIKDNVEANKSRKGNEGGLFVCVVIVVLLLYLYLDLTDL